MQIKYCGDTPFYIILTFVKKSFRIGSGITVKTSWVGGKSENLMPGYFANGLGFTVVLKAKLELKIQFLKKVS